MIDGHNAKDVHSLAEIPGYPFVLIMLEDGTVVQQQPPRNLQGVLNHITTAVNEHVGVKPSDRGTPV